MSGYISDTREGMTIVTFTRAELSNNRVVSDLGSQLSAIVNGKDVKWLLLNFQYVSFLTSEMIGQFAMLKKKCAAANVNLKICNVEPSMQRVLKLVRLDSMFEIVANEAEALQSFKRESNPEATQPYDMGIDLTRTAAKYRAAAETGISEAQYQLGRCYENGWGVEQDFTIALKWYGKATRQNYAEAQNALAQCYAYGIGVTQDYGEAIQLYRQAAEQGVASSQYVMGLSYDFGIGVPADPALAVEWYQRAAAQGDVRAQEALEELMKLPPA